MTCAAFAVSTPDAARSVVVPDAPLASRTGRRHDNKVRPGTPRRQGDLGGRQRVFAGVQHAVAVKVINQSGMPAARRSQRQGENVRAASGVAEGDGEHHTGEPAHALAVGRRREGDAGLHRDLRPHRWPGC